MFLFNKRKRTGGIMDEIRCDESSYLIWKWHPAGLQPGESARENAIRMGSSLRVKDGEMAIFVYNQGDGLNQDIFLGPCDQILDTDNLPVLSSIIGLAYEGGTPFPAEIYFINLAQIVQVRFAVPFFDVFDPRFPDYGVPVAVRGTISFKISDYYDFIQKHQLNTFNMEDFQRQIKDVVCRYVKDTVANAPAEHNIPLVQIESKISQINDIVEYDLGERLHDDFGVTVSGIDIGAIELDKSSDAYRLLMSVSRDLAGAAARTEAETKIKNISDKQRIEAENYQETLRVQREENQYAQRKATQSLHFAAYQVEKQAEVGKAAADALGNMGRSGAASISMGGTGGAFSPAAMMASMAIGNAVGQNMAGTMNDILGSTSQSGIVPPPIPSTVFYVAINGQATGPYDFQTLEKMVKTGELKSESLLWRPGMATWEAAASIEGIKSLFNKEVPPVPTK